MEHIHWWKYYFSCNKNNLKSTVHFYSKISLFGYTFLVNGFYFKTAEINSIVWKWEFHSLQIFFSFLTVKENAS